MVPTFMASQLLGWTADHRVHVAVPQTDPPEILKTLIEELGAASPDLDWSIHPKQGISLPIVTGQDDLTGTLLANPEEQQPGILCSGHIDYQTIVNQATPFSPPSGPATGSCNGLHRESNFLAFRTASRAGFGWQMRAMRSSQISRPLRISTSIRRK